jgi:hypothetical protein
MLTLTECLVCSSLSIKIHGVLSACRSTDGNACFFPFVFGGKIYKTCTDDGSAPGDLWCSRTENYDRDGSRSSCTCGNPDLSSVFYTTDGSEPTGQSMPYDAVTGIQLTGFGERIVKVRNFKTGNEDSPVVEGSYSLLPQTVSTLAGSLVGARGFQDGSGTFSRFSQPNKLVVSPDYACVYIADTGNHKIRHFDLRSGFATTFVGGNKGFEDGVGTNAKFDNPQGLALTSDGRYLYVGDTGNKHVRKITVLSRHVETIIMIPYHQRIALFRSSNLIFSMPTTSGFKVNRISMTHEWKWIMNHEKVQCTSRSYRDSNGHQCTDYDRYPQWCGFEGSAYACCVCGGGVDVAVRLNETSQAFGSITDVTLSLNETVLYISDGEENTINALILSTGQVRVIAGGGANTSDAAYGTRAGFHRPFGMDVSIRTEGILLFICDFFLFICDV